MGYARQEVTEIYSTYTKLFAVIMMTPNTIEENDISS